MPAARCARPISRRSPWSSGCTAACSTSSKTSSIGAGAPTSTRCRALLLYNIGDKELTAGELRTRGYYLGSNVSYNVKKLVEMGYLHHSRSRLDRRSVRISLTDKGQEVHTIVAGLYEKHISTVEQIGGISTDEFAQLNQSLARLERFWTDQIRFRL